MSKMNTLSFLLVCASAALPGIASAESQQFQHIETPVGPGGQEPTLFALIDGRLAMSWTEPDTTGFAVKMAILDGKIWGASRTIVRSDRLFVNWADFPSVVGLPDGTLAAHWLQESEIDPFAYDVNIAFSSDDGATWGATIVPHRDGIDAQHGFVSMLPVANDQLLTVWLDGRAYKTGLAKDRAAGLPDAMQLRATRVSSVGTLSDDILVDNQTCSCCQTSATATADGTILVAYRNRTDAEIRDIAVVRQVNGEWTKPKIVHDDGWEIAGCPVNGPAIDAFGQTAVVAWFTAANNEPIVKIAFSADVGASFDAPTRIDLGAAVGHVDAMMLSERSALITWVEWKDSIEIIYACTVGIGAECENPQIVTSNTGAGSVNFPRMARVGNSVYMAWTQPTEGTFADSSQDSTISLVVFDP